MARDCKHLTKLVRVEYPNKTNLEINCANCLVAFKPEMSEQEKKELTSRLFDDPSSGLFTDPYFNGHIK